MLASAPIFYGDGLGSHFLHYWSLIPFFTVVSVLIFYDVGLFSLSTVLDSVPIIYDVGLGSHFYGIGLGSHFPRCWPWFPFSTGLALFPFSTAISYKTQHSFVIQKLVAARSRRWCGQRVTQVLVV